MPVTTLTQQVGIPPLAGPEGERGPQGPVGPRGPKGQTGVEGTSPPAYVPYTKIQNKIRAILDAYLEVSCPEFVFLDGAETGTEVQVTTLLKNTQNEVQDVSQYADLDLVVYPDLDFLQIYPEGNQVVVRVLESRVACSVTVTIRVRAQSEFPIPPYTGGCMLEVKIGA